MPEDYMSNPLDVYQRYLKATQGVTPMQLRWLRYGVLGMALCMVTVIKSLEQLPVASDVGRQEAIVAMQTLLTEMGIAEEAYETYEMLASWRRPTFEPLVPGL